MNWITLVEIVDIETGELLTKKQFKSGQWYITKKEKLKTEFNDDQTQGIKKVRYHAKRHRQLNLQYSIIGTT